MRNNFDITAIEDDVREILRSLNVSSKIYTNRPKEADPAADFVVVKVSGSLQDERAYGSCVVLVSLFARDNDSFKNGKKLSAMYQKLSDGFPASTDRLIFDTELNVLGDSPDDFGFHARTIRIKTTIKAI